MKKVFLVAVIFCVFGIIDVFASQPSLFVNNKKLNFTEQGPVIIDNRLLVPVRGIFESVGATVTWDPVPKTIHIRYKENEIKMFVDSKRYSVTDKNTGVNVFYDFEVVPQILNNRTLIPLRAVTDGLGGQTNWDPKTKSAYINFGAEVIDEFQTKALEFTIEGKKVQMLQTSSEVRNILGIPQREAKNEAGDLFYTYTGDYKGYIFLGFKGGQLAYAVSNSKNFSANGFKAGSGGYTSPNMNFGADALYFYEDERGTIAAIAASSNGFAPRNLPVSEVEMQIFDFTNGFRVSRGFKPLTYNSKLAGVARKHSEDMAGNDYFSHISQDGRTFDKRITDGGIQFSAAAENIAYGTNDPFRIVHMWILSDGHRANLFRDIDELGVGGSSKGYYTQCFATRK
ncbi:MAG: CAP domain-containing protein [Clostridiales bacterium]|nr:CAP domain-containing protein [Clostridiales bacterium]